MKACRIAFGPWGPRISKVYGAQLPRVQSSLSDTLIKENTETNLAQKPLYGINFTTGPYLGLVLGYDKRFCIPTSLLVHYYSNLLAVFPQFL